MVIEALPGHLNFHIILAAFSRVFTKVAHIVILAMLFGWNICNVICNDAVKSEKKKLVCFAPSG